MEGELRVRRRRAGPRLVWRKRTGAEILQSPPEGVQPQESAHEYLGVLLKSRKQAESQEVKQTMPSKAESGSICEASPSGVRKGGGL